MRRIAPNFSFFNATLFPDIYISDLEYTLKIFNWELKLKLIL